MRLNIFRVVLGVISLCAAVALGVGSLALEAKATSLEELVAGAKKETKLRGQWSASSLGGGSGFSRIVAGMNKKYGLNITPEFTPGPNMQRMMGKIIREVAAGQSASSDVYWGNAQAMLQAVKAEKRPLRQMEWDALLEQEMLSEPGFDPVATGGIGIASASTLVGVTYNSDLVTGNDIPRRLEDVLAPKWKGRIASTPYAAGLREFAMPDLLGREYILQYARKLSQHVGGLIRCGEMDRITSGEFLMLVLSCGDQYVNQAKRKGIPLGYSVMEDAVVSHTRYGGVPVNSSAPNAAALFLAYLHTKEGQELMWDEDGYDFHLYPGSHVKADLDRARAAGAKVVINSPQWLGSNPGYRKMQREIEGILRKKK